MGSKIRDNFVNIPAEGLPIRTKEDLFNYAFVTVFGNFMRKGKLLKGITAKDMFGMLLGMKLFAAAYHELILSGRMEEWDVTKLCEKIGLGEEEMAKARKVTKNMFKGIAGVTDEDFEKMINNFVEAK